MSSSDTIHLSYRVEPELIRRAMTAAGRSNRRNVAGIFAQIFQMVPWFALIAVFAFGMREVHQWYDASPTSIWDWYIYVLIGSGLLVIYGRLLGHLVSLSHIQQSDDLNVDMLVDADGIRLTTEHTTSNLAWAAVNRIVSFRGGFGFRMASTVYAIPESALRGGMKKADAVKQFETWREAGGTFG